MSTTLLSLEELTSEETPCQIAVQRAEDARQESRIMGYILIVLVAVVALALCVVIALAVAGLTTEAIITAVGGIVDGIAAGFVVTKRKDANNRARLALNDAKRICRPDTAERIG